MTQEELERMFPGTREMSRKVAKLFTARLAKTLDEIEADAQLWRPK